MGDSPAAVGEFVPLEALFDGGRGPGPRLGVPRRHLVGGQIEGALLDQVDKFGAGSRRSDFFRPMAAEVLQPASEPDGVFGQNGSIGVAGDKIGEVERAVRCFDPTDAFAPPLDAQAAGVQFDHTGDVAVEDGNGAGAGDDAGTGEDGFAGQLAQQEARQRRRSTDEFAAVNQHLIPFSLSPRSQAHRGRGAFQSDCRGSLLTW